MCRSGKSIGRQAMRLRLVAAFVAAMLAFSRPAAAASSPLDGLARDYVVLAAEAGRIEPDSFGVGDDLNSIARPAKGRPLARQLVVARLNQLVRRLDRLPPPADPMLAMRRRYL